MPIPNEGYWTSYDNVTHAHMVYECHKGTCTGGGDTDSRCWVTANYSKCDADELMCSEGATSLFCSACEEGYQYSVWARRCESCEESSQTGAPRFLDVGIGLIFVLLLLSFALKYRGNTNKIHIQPLNLQHPSLMNLKVLDELESFISV